MDNEQPKKSDLKKSLYERITQGEFNIYGVIYGLGIVATSIFFGIKATMYRRDYPLGAMTRGIITGIGWPVWLPLNTCAYIIYRSLCFDHKDYENSANVRGILWI